LFRVFRARLGSDGLALEPVVVAACIHVVIHGHPVVVHRLPRVVRLVRVVHDVPVLALRLMCGSRVFLPSPTDRLCVFLLFLLLLVLFRDGLNLSRRLPVLLVAPALFPLALAVRP